MTPSDSVHQALEAFSAAEPAARSRVPSHRTLDGFALASGTVDGVDVQSLETGAVLVVDTRNSRYRLVVLDGPDQRVLIEGGSVFPEMTEAYVDGATAGGSMIKAGWIGPGLRLELSAGSRRIVTSPVRSVAFESVPPRQLGEHTRPL